MKIAVIGSGIAGLSAAYYLSKNHKIDLFEKESHFGGHSHTVAVTTKKNTTIYVDVGFIVFNYLTYPNLINFFKENDVEIEKSNMSFSVSVKGTSVEYCGKGINGIFSNKYNLFDYKFIKMFYDIINFYKKNQKNIQNYENITLEDYLTKENLSKYFIEYHLIPMVSAIWSMPPYEAKKMPLQLFLNFFQNHGLFKLSNRPQWYTVKNRSKTYVEKVLKKISGEYYKNYPILNIKRVSSGVQVFYGKNNEYFNYDKVIIATHADDALKLIENPTQQEKLILRNFSYKINKAYLHFDENVMPKNKKNWSSWNSTIDKDISKGSSLTYWLNILQNLKTEENIFLTLNPFFEIKKNKIYKEIEFTHPYYDQNTIDNQKKLIQLQNSNNILFCGSYFGYGFHEDAIKSSIEMVKILND